MYMCTVTCPRCTVTGRRSEWNCSLAAVRRLDGNTYAIKELDLRYLQKREQIECIREIKVLSDLNSPYIIKYFDSFLDQGQLYIVTEFASKGSVHDLIDKYRGQVQEDICWKLAIQTVLGLQHMHNKGVLHRDVKSLNLLLDAEKNIKIADLGIATVVSGPKGFAKTLVGTPYYLSPELCEGKLYNEKSDIWALGVVLYECCTGKYPFDAQSQASLILKITAGQYADVTGYSAEMRSLIKRCLTHSPDRRPNTATSIGLCTSSFRHLASLGNTGTGDLQHMGCCFASHPQHAILALDPDRILSLPAVRAKAKQLGIGLPEVTSAKVGEHSKEQLAFAYKAPRYTADTPCTGNLLTRRPSSAGTASKDLDLRRDVRTCTTQSVQRRASESSLGRIGPGGAAVQSLPDDVLHKPLGRIQPAWRDRIANLRLHKPGQPICEECSTAFRAVLPEDGASEYDSKTGCQP